MKALCHKLRALTVTAAMAMFAVGTPAVASMHGDCVSAHHDCGVGTLAVSCFCGHEGEPSTQATVESVVRCAPDCFITSVALPAASHLSCSMVIAPVQTSPPRGSPPDFPTLYASLLI